MRDVHAADRRIARPRRTDSTRTAVTPTDEAAADSGARRPFDRPEFGSVSAADMIPPAGPYRPTMDRVAISLAVVLLVSAGTSAQTVGAAPPDAATVARWVRDFYAQTTSLQLEFDQHAWERSRGRTRSFHGTLRTERPGRTRFDFTTPAGRVVVVSRSEAITYEPIEGGSGEYWRAPSTAAALALLGILTDAVPIAHDFTYELDDAVTTPAGTVCLALRPRRPDEEFVLVHLYVSAEPEARGAVSEMGIEDQDGNRNTFVFDLESMQLDPQHAPGTFDFEPPIGARETTPPLPGSGAR